MDTARSIGLAGEDGVDVYGTIDQDVVLASISALAFAHPGNDDVFADAAARVQLARSAGVQHYDAASVLHRSDTGASVQLRYRSEMADLFTDLAIDVGLLNRRRLADTAV